MSADPIEWEFGVPASQVDLQRVYVELGSCPAIVAASYMSKLRREAPTVYARLREWAKERELMIWWFMNQEKPSN